MKNHFLMMVLLQGISMSCQCEVSKETTHKTMHTIEEDTFEHFVHIRNGCTKQEWFINKKAVDHEDYQEQLTQAKIKEFNKQQEQENKRLQNDIEYKRLIQESLIKKLLDACVQKIEYILQSIEKQQLQDYLVFSQSLFTSNVDFVTFKHYTLLPAQTLLINTHFDLEKAQDLLPLLEQALDPLQKLYEHSLEHAIKKCDDPKQLKIWLELLS